MILATARDRLAFIDVVAPAAMFAATALFLALGMSHDLNIYDEGLILTGAMRVLDGDFIHRDFYANYGPGQFYALAAVFKLFGPSALAERAWDVEVQAGITTVTSLVVRRVAPWGTAAAAAALVAIWLCAFGYYAYPVFPALLFLLIGVRCLCPLIEDRGAWPWTLAAGAALGVAALFRYDVGLAAAATCSAFVVIRRCAASPSWRETFASTMRALLALWAGIALVCLPVALAFSSHGVIGDLLFDIVWFPAQFYRRMRALPFPSPRDIMASAVEAGVYLPVAVWLAALAAGLANRGHRPVTSGAWLVALLSALSIVLYAKGLVRVGAIQMSLSIVPAVIVAVLLFPMARDAARRARFGPGAVAGIGVFMVFALATLAAMKADALALAEGVAWVMRPTTWTAAEAPSAPELASCHAPPGVPRMACFGVEAERVAAIRYIVAHTGPRDALFVGLDRHDRVHINDNLFYFLAARRPATKWSHFDPGLQTSEKIQAEMIAELKARKPPYVVLDAGFTGLEEPNDSGRSSGVVLLDTYIRSAFSPVATFGSLAIWKAAGR